MSFTWLKCMLYVLSATLIQVPNIESCIEEERNALLELKSYIKSHADPENKYSSYSGWLDFESERYNCCAWEKVQCNPITQRVIKLDFNGVVFAIGKIFQAPPWLFNTSLFRPFTELTSLDLSYNTITGFIEIDGLTKLQELDLSSNYINGSIRELANLRELRVLRIDTNMFSGPIEGVCKLKKIEELRLYHNDFHGDVPSCLQNLSALQVVDFSSNQFKGKFPKVFLSLTSLKDLDLSDNYFHGKLSLSSFANHSKLQMLEISRNKLEIQTDDSSWQPTFQLKSLGLESCSLNKPYGTIPKFLSYQHNLIRIDLNNNSLVGSFPTWLLNNNTELQVLLLQDNSLTGFLQLPRSPKPSILGISLSNNHFQGKIPKNIGFLLPSLFYLDMAKNDFEGKIPTSICKFAQFWTLDLSSNNFSGELPKRLLSDCNTLVVLKLSDNNLQGEIIPEQMNLPALTLLKLSNNYFSGTIKDSLMRSSGLISLDISNNEVKGRLPRWIGNFPSLKAIEASKNSLQGRIPTEICKLQLTFLDLSQNNLTGSLPSCSNFSSLLYMHLHMNHLSGSIPNVLSSCSTLEALDLSDNLLSGSIPSWIHKLSSLRVLLLRGNNLHGKVPHQMCRLEDMNILDLSRNHLFGEIPTCLRYISFGRKTTDQYGVSRLFTPEFDNQTNNYFVQEEVEFLAKNRYLSYVGGNHLLMSGLDLSCNNLSGVIPSEVGDLRYIHSLNLSHNCLSGSIPSSFSDLKQIESLDLSYNKLTGIIPPQLVELNFLEIFNVSYNNLTGRTPQTGQFGNFDESNYLGNPGLCGSSVKKSCNPSIAPPSPTPKQDQAGDGDAAIDMTNFLWSFSMSSVIAFLATIAVLYINPRWRMAWFDFIDWHILRRFHLPSLRDF